MNLLKIAAFLIIKLDNCQLQVMASKITYEAEITLDDLIKEGNLMFNKCKASISVSHPSILETVSSDLGNLLWRDHKQFSTAYPIVANLMTRGYYHPDAFKSFVNYIKNQTHKTEDEFLDNQAKYIRPLMRKLGVRDQRVINQLYSETRNALAKNSKGFKTALTKAEKTVAEIEKKAADQRREDLKLLISNDRDKLLTLSL